MSFLYPFMLLGMLGLSIPVVLHLIARSKFPVRQFPSVQLLAAERRDNSFARRLVDRWQLLLRLLCLLLMVLAMSRLHINLPWTSSPKNMAIVLDASASMSDSRVDPENGQPATLFDQAKRRAAGLLGRIGSTSQTALILAGGEDAKVLSDLSTGSAATLLAMEKASVTDSGGNGLIEGIARAAEMLRGRRERVSQIVVFTDLRGSAFEERDSAALRAIRNTAEAMGRRLDIVFVGMSGSQTNAGILNAEVRGGTVSEGGEAHIITRVRNYSPTECKVSLRLRVNNQSVPGRKEILLPPGEDVVADLTAPVDHAFRAFAEVQMVTEDTMMFDDVFRIPINVKERQRVLIVNGSGVAPPLVAGAAALANLQKKPATGADLAAASRRTINGADILAAVLNPAGDERRTYDTGIRTKVILPEDIDRENLSYNALILYDISRLSEDQIGKVQDFTANGGSLLVFVGQTVNPLDFNKVFATGDSQKPALTSVRIGSYAPLSPAAAIRLPRPADTHEVFRPFHDPLQGDLSGIRFSALRRLTDIGDPSQVMLSTDTGAPLLTENPYGNGRVALTTFGLELDGSDIAMSRAFPSLMFRLLDHLTGTLNKPARDVFLATRAGVMDVSEKNFAFDTTLLLSTESRTENKPSTSFRLTITPGRTVMLPPLPSGNYYLHRPGATESAHPTAQGYYRCVTVNTDPAEGVAAPWADQDVRRVFGQRARTITPKAFATLDVRGMELWRYLMMFLFAAYAVEAVAGWIMNTRRETERLAKT
jgi:hypothetical protein